MSRAQKVLENLSHMTAMSRTGLSAPARYLLEKGLLRGRVLDHGCGKGDICRFTDIPHAEQYDPHWHPQRPQGKFDTIYSGFVINAVPENVVSHILADIKSFLAPGGTAYIAVRRDVKQEGFTSKGTEQYNRELQLPVLINVPGRYIIYVMKG